MSKVDESFVSFLHRIVYAFMEHAQSIAPGASICLYGGVSENVKKQDEVDGASSLNSGLEREMDPDQWVDRYGDRLYKYALARVREASLAEDLVQETFLSAVKAYGDFEGRSAVKTWLLTILKNKIIDHYRKVKRQGEAVSLDSDTDTHTAGMTLGIWNTFVHNWASNPDELVEGQEFLGALNECFRKLPDRYKKLFQVKLADDLSTEEICNLFDISASNYWVLLHRIRMQLRQCLDKNWYAK
ncbi:MAG: sigma-70 family RNA polymerase sigma factor [Bdellovibrionales bacterium]|nr:sigma-70 family RNA polymerase sigma factor [Bdellovibrionales bacterium]